MADFFQKNEYDFTDTNLQYLSATLRFIFLIVSCYLIFNCQTGDRSDSITQSLKRRRENTALRSFPIDTSVAAQNTYPITVHL